MIADQEQIGILCGKENANLKTIDQDLKLPDFSRNHSAAEPKSSAEKVNHIDLDVSISRQDMQ